MIRAGRAASVVYSSCLVNRTAGDAMTEGLLALLREVAAGKRTFRCASNAEGPLRKFQAVADNLLWLEAGGYIAGCEAGEEMVTGKRYVNRVHVRGGLTEEGRRALSIG
jgi:hypothetical protein